MLTTTVLASPEPVVFCPNVHPEMWNKAAVQQNVEMLREDGHVVIEPEVATAYEVDSGETRDGLVVPEPSDLAQRLRELHRRQALDSPTTIKSPMGSSTGRLLLQFHALGSRRPWFAANRCIVL